MGKLDGKAAIVTGAGSGMGRATAALLASEGAKVVVADIDETGAAETVALIAAEGGDAVAVVGDISVNKDVQQIVGTALSTYGRIDALHNNAGILRTFASIEEHSEDVWRRVIDVNLTGYFLMSRAVMPLMRAGGGAIVNTASMAAIHPYAPGPAYSASKAGVLSLTTAFAEAGAGDGIRVNAICPAGVDTPILDWASQPVPADRSGLGLMAPSDIARLVLYFITHPDMTGQAIAARWIDGRARYHFVDVSVTDRELVIG